MGSRRALLPLFTAALIGAATAAADAESATCLGRSVTLQARAGEVVVGTAGPDVIRGTPGRDVCARGAVETESVAEEATIFYAPATAAIEWVVDSAMTRFTEGLSTTG